MAEDDGAKRREAMRKLREMRGKDDTRERPATGGPGAARGAGGAGGGAGGNRGAALRELIAKRKGGGEGAAAGGAAGGGLREKLKERIVAGQGGASKGGGGLAKILAQGGGGGLREKLLSGAVGGGLNGGGLREKLGGGAGGGAGGGGLRDKLGGAGGGARSEKLKEILARRKGAKAAETEVEDAEVVGEDAETSTPQDPDRQRRLLRERIRKLQAKLDELDLDAMDDADLTGEAPGDAAKD